MNADDEYLITSCRSIMKDCILGICRTDSFLRQPDYSSRCDSHLYLITTAVEEQEIIPKLRYIQAEFPNHLLNYLTVDELGRYPPHATWQFIHAHWHVQSPCVRALVENMRCDWIEAARQAIFSVGHLARLYYLRELSSRAAVWGIRQLGWAMRYAECGICSLTNAALGNTYAVHPAPAGCESDVAWLLACNQDWPRIEKRLLDGDPADFRVIAARLSDLAEKYAVALDARPPKQDQHFVMASPVSTPLPPELARTTDDNVNALQAALGDNFKSYHLHGSAARGDTRAGSDIDAIVVLETVDRASLDRLRKTQQSFDNLSFSAYSESGLRQYPHFRRYALQSGVRTRFGHALTPIALSHDAYRAAVLNNTYTIRQISRAYLMGPGYGPRAHYVVTLMVKLADHGCMRLLMKIEGQHRTILKDDVLSFFGNAAFASDILKYLADIDMQEGKIAQDLLSGDAASAERMLYALLGFATQIERRTLQQA